MSDPARLVTREAVEKFSLDLMQSGAFLIKPGRTKDWLDKVFKSPEPIFVSHHAWRNYLAIFVYENQDQLIKSDLRAIDAKADQWFFSQPSLHRTLQVP